ncbi:MAG: lipopolysaccharide biosynthesis protein [Acidimicrobiia bacterium]|nr:lipopolysaccharide biosynthesis protein [Acidimicrobiia bacterium]
MADVVSGDGQPSLTQSSTRGLAWLFGGSAVTKLVSVLAQVALAWILLEEDFGLFGLGFSVVAVVTLIQRAGLRQTLIARGARFDYWSAPAVWLSLVLGVVAAGIMLLVAPVAARFYDAPDVAGLIRVLAIGALLQAIAIVPMAHLAIELRFRAITFLELVGAVGQAVLSVVLATAGFEAYSFVIPVPVTSGIIAIVAWWVARPPVSLRLHLNRWRPLLADSATLLGAALLAVVWFQGDYIVLGRFHDATVVGLYYFAFGLSMQTMKLLIGKIETVLFPTLSRITEDGRRQTRAFLRAASLLAVVGLFLSLLQAAVADPLIRLVFADRWTPAIPILQILSVGMAFRFVGSPASALLRAQGRFRTILGLNAVFASVFMAAVTIGALVGAAVSVAVAAAVFFVFMGPTQMLIAVRPGGGSIVDVARVFFPALPIATAAVGAGLAAAWLVGTGVDFHAVRIGVTVTVAGLAYVVLVRRLMPAAWHEAVARIRDLRGGSSTTPSGETPGRKEHDAEAIPSPHASEAAP